MGLLDRAFMDAGFEVRPGCEIDPDMRLMYSHLCGGTPLVCDINLLPMLVAGDRYQGIIGGPPCQSHTRLRAMRKPKYPDLTPHVRAVLDCCSWDWFVFENVAPLRLGLGEKHVRLDAMHYGRPHQSRPRWFTYSPNLTPPEPLYAGTVDSLMAYSIVAGRIYGPKRGAVLQGYPAAAGIPVRCVTLQKGLANAVHYGLGLAWAERVKSFFTHTV